MQILVFSGDIFKILISRTSHLGPKKVSERFRPEAEFKEFESRLKYGWFHLKLYSIFQDLSWRSIETGFWQT